MSLTILIIDYVNKRGGKMGVVLQVQLKQGSTCKDWLARFGLAVQEPVLSTQQKK